MASDSGAVNGEDPRDWREWAHLRKDNWPEAIPPMGPKREHGPYPWGEPGHDDPDGLDDYPASHPDASSIGESYIGDVCPYCGVPLRWDETVVLADSGDYGVFRDISDLRSPEVAYHSECHAERRAAVNHSLGEFARGETGGE